MLFTINVLPPVPPLTVNVGEIAWIVGCRGTRRDGDGARRSGVVVVERPGLAGRVVLVVEVERGEGGSMSMMEIGPWMTAIVPGPPVEPMLTVGDPGEVGEA